MEGEGNSKQNIEKNVMEGKELCFDSKRETDYYFSVNRDDENVHKKKLKCTHPGCDKTFQRPDRIKRHMLLHEDLRMYTCSMLLCGKSYVSTQHLRRHHKVAHTETTKEISEVHCDDNNCNKTFQTRSGMIKHYKKVHVNTKKKYTCEQCFTSFLYCAEYYMHMNKEHGIRKITCDKCDLTFTCQTDKTRHMRGHRTWVCNEKECKGLLFDTFNEKRKHDATVHPTVFFCHHCNFQTQRKTFLEEHIIKKHTSEWDKPLFSCTYPDCKSIFQHKRNYMQHYKKKHLSKASIFNCPLGCTQTFATKQSSLRHVINVHKNIDGKEKESTLPFSCDICKKKFGKELNVRRHILRMHNNCPKAPTINNLVNSVYIKPGDKPTAPRQGDACKKFIPSPAGSCLKMEKPSSVVKLSDEDKLEVNASMNF